jgi:phosphate transport system protein
MTNLEQELKEVKDLVLEMLKLVLAQLEKAGDAFMSFDEALAEEVIHSEKRVNAMELTIDKKCENVFALYNPVASDLRFVISMLKMNSDIERIGDYADGISDYVVDLEEPIDKNYLEKSRIADMFEIAYNMLDMVIISIESDNAELPRQVFKRDRQLNKINHASSDLIEKMVKADATNTSSALYLFSTIKKVERIGDHIKNIAEDWIFYLDGEVLKHRKKLPKKKG